MAVGEVDDKIVKLKYERAFYGKTLAPRLHCIATSGVSTYSFKWRSWCVGEETLKRGD